MLIHCEYDAYTVSKVIQEQLTAETNDPMGDCFFLQFVPRSLLINFAPKSLQIKFAPRSLRIKSVNLTYTTDYRDLKTC